MGGVNLLVDGNVDKMWVVCLTYDANVTATNTTQESDITVKGVKLGDLVFVNKPSHSAGVGIVNARVKAADTVSVQYVNATGSGVNPAAELYCFFIVRPNQLLSVVP